ncbi:MAG: hypothetical protein ATN35_12235 [Epulopiscium sp. Nele67-Bin004]|nr:MAG: hypothetical protein ATN35_12235 [Epulopiscium sp. Nele67-Bin004]
MLKQCQEIFQIEYNTKGEALITNNYTLDEGIYILVNKNYEAQEPFIFVKPKKLKQGKEAEKIDRNSEYNMFAEMDYYSKLIEMNKPIDPKKAIHSNNLYSVWVKAENLSNGKLTDQIIDGYFNVLANPQAKYKKSKILSELYQNVEEQVGEVDLDKLEKNREWIKNNIFNYGYQTKGYVKIYFEADIAIYKQEAERYLKVNIFNKPETIIKTKDDIIGAPSNNFGLNDNKVYLRNKTRKCDVPYLITAEEAILQKKFFDYLYNEAVAGNRYIYIDTSKKMIMPTNGILSQDDGKDFNGYLLQVQKGKEELEILDCDILANYSNKVENFKAREIFEDSYTHSGDDGIAVGEYTKLEDIQKLVHRLFFSKFIVYRGDVSSTLKDSVVRESIYMYRKAFEEWFYKGNTIPVSACIDKLSTRLIANSLEQGYFPRARRQFVLADAIKCYLNKESETMADVANKLIGELTQKVSSKSNEVLESDEQYYVAVGQMLYYLQSYSKAGKNMQNFINPVLNSKSDKRIKDILMQLYKRYNYDMYAGSRRFNNLYSMVLGYTPENKVDENFIIYGYLTNNILFTKEKGEQTNE